jgi:WhiB family transcriptional regulator, redox-sensing transcriptional regulator
MTARDVSLAAIAGQLASLCSIPNDRLADFVTRDGACMEVSAVEDPPCWLYNDGTDRELAARLCEGCPVQAECLELELRMNGDLTVGVWGALCEDDRRALIPHRRRDAKGVEHGLQ